MAKEVSEILGFAMNCGRLLFDDLLENDLAVKFFMGSRACAEFDGQNSQRPNINFFSVGFLLDDFRSHPKNCALKPIAVGFLFGKLCNRPKITNFNVSLSAQQNILALDVSVDLMLLVNFIEPSEHFLENVGNSVFRNGSFVALNKVKQRPTIHVLYKHINFFLNNIAEMIAKDVIAFAHVHHGNLFTHPRHERILLALHVSDRIFLSWAVSSLDKINLTVSPISQFLFESKMLIWVACLQIDLFHFLLELFGGQEIQFFFGLFIKVRHEVDDYAHRLFSLAVCRFHLSKLVIFLNVYMGFTVNLEILDFWFLPHCTDRRRCFH